MINEATGEIAKGTWTDLIIDNRLELETFRESLVFGKSKEVQSDSWSLPLLDLDAVSWSMILRFLDSHLFVVNLREESEQFEPTSPEFSRHLEELRKDSHDQHLDGWFRSGYGSTRIVPWGVVKSIPAQRTTGACIEIKYI